MIWKYTQKARKLFNMELLCPMSVQKELEIGFEDAMDLVAVLGRAGIIDFEDEKKNESSSERLGARELTPEARVLFAAENFSAPAVQMALRVGYGRAAALLELLEEFELLTRRKRKPSEKKR